MSIRKRLSGSDIREGKIRLLGESVKSCILSPIRVSEKEQEVAITLVHEHGRTDVVLKHDRNVYVMDAADFIKEARLQAGNKISIRHVIDRKFNVALKTVETQQNITRTNNGNPATSKKRTNLIGEENLKRNKSCTQPATNFTSETPNSNPFNQSHENNIQVNFNPEGNSNSQSKVLSLLNLDSEGIILNQNVSTKINLNEELGNCTQTQRMHSRRELDSEGIILNQNVCTEINFPEVIAKKQEVSRQDGILENFFNGAEAAFQWETELDGYNIEF